MSPMTTIANNSPPATGVGNGKDIWRKAAMFTTIPKVCGSSMLRMLVHHGEVWQNSYNLSSHAIAAFKDSAPPVWGCVISLTLLGCGCSLIAHWPHFPIQYNL